MKNDSKYLQEFIKTEYIKPLNIPKFTFSPISKQVISRIYALLLSAETAFTNIQPNNIRFIGMYDNDTSESNESGKSYDYIPAEFQKTIQTTKMVHLHYILKIGKRSINTNIFIPEYFTSEASCTQRSWLPTGVTDSKSAADNISLKRRTYSQIKKTGDQMIYKMYIWLHIASQYANKMCSRNMNIFLYMLDCKKQLPSVDRRAVDRVHTNTAFTTACSLETDIYLFREEEWFKVFIHETFHNLGLDFSTMDQTDIENRIRQIFPIPSLSNIRVYETYCETWAELMNIMFISHWATKEQTDTNIIKKMESFIQVERTFSLFQCIKLLHHYDLTYNDIYATSLHKPASNTALKRYKENTQVFSYLVLKSILMFSLNDFLEWCMLHNKGTVEFSKTPLNMTQYYQLFEKLYIRPDLLKCIEDMTRVYNESYNKNRIVNQTPIKQGKDSLLKPAAQIKDFEYETLRFTAVEI